MKIGIKNLKFSLLFEIYIKENLTI